MSSPLGSDDYREGALARLEEARRLRDQQQWVGAVYLAGRAVEAILRSLLWLRGRQQEIGHDLRDLLKRTRSLGILSSDDTELGGYVNDIAVIWYNNLRFVGDNRFLRDLRAAGRHKHIYGRRIKGDVLKANARHVVEMCEAIVTRGDRVWVHYKRSSSRS